MPSDIVTNIRWLRFSWFEYEDVLRKTKLHSMLINTAELINQTVRLQNPSPFFPVTSFLSNFIRRVDSALELSELTGACKNTHVNGPC